MSFRKEREKAAAAAADAPRIKFDDTPPPTEQVVSPRGGSGRSSLRSSGSTPASSGGGVAFKLTLPSTSSSSSSSTNTSPSSSSSSSSKSSVFTPRSMLNKVKHTLSLASADAADDGNEPSEGGEGVAEGKDGKDKKRSGSSRHHKRSRSMGDAKAAAVLVPQRDPVDRTTEQQAQAQQVQAPGSPGTHKTGSSITRRKGSMNAGSFLSFSSSSTKLKSQAELAASGDGSIERSASDASVTTMAGLNGDNAEAGDDDNEPAEGGEGTATEGKDGEANSSATTQRRKWGSLQRRNNSLVIKKSSTTDNITTQLAGSGSPSKRNTVISEANGNRMDRTQRRRYRILVSSPRGTSSAALGGEEGANGEGELDADAADDLYSDSDDSGGEESLNTSEERKRSHTLAAGAKGLLKTPRFFHKDGREKRSNLPQGDSEPIISFRPSLDEGRHRRTNSTDVSFLEPGASEDVHLKTVHMRYKEMEDLQLGGKERRERNKRLSVHVDQVLSHRPSYDSLVHRGILKEWSEPSAKNLQDFPAHLPPLVWSANSTDGKIDGWNVERGTTQDIVFGARSSLEDEGYISFYETHFYKSEYTTWWGVDGEFGPIIICIHKQPVTAGEAESEAQACSTADPSLFSSDTGVPTTNSHFGATSILRRLGEKATGGKPASGLLSLYRVLIQTKKGGKQLFIRSTEKSAEKLKALKTALGSQGYLTGEVASFNDIKFKKLKDLDIREDLLYLEKKFFSTDYKFGVLYVKKGQTENQMFSNLTTDTSPEFEKFLGLMGEKITLKGFKGYTGGLDIKADTTGVESVFTEFRNQRIMYHVSTLLPFYPRDEQQVERKRHLGNDIVVIVFVEPGAQFDPTPMKTQFNHIYCVVCAEKTSTDGAPAAEEEAADGSTKTAGGSRVRIEFAVKQGVRPFGPPLPDPNETHFQLDTNLREFLLSKLVNSERAALKAPAFASKMEKTRKIFIEQLIDTKILNKK